MCAQHTLIPLSTLQYYAWKKMVAKRLTRKKNHANSQTACSVFPEDPKLGSLRNDPLQRLGRQWFGKGRAGAHIRTTERLMLGHTRTAGEGRGGCAPWDGSEFSMFYAIKSGLNIWGRNHM